MRRLKLSLLLIAFILGLAPYPGQARNLSGQPSRRRPASIVLNEDGTRLFVANRRSGSISVIDTTTLQVRGETKVGNALADVAYLPGRIAPARAGMERLLAVDEESHELLVLGSQPNASELRVIERLAVSPYPVTIAVTEDGRLCTVASLWSKRLDLIDLSSSAPRLTGSLELPFFPREQALLPNDSFLVVADSFGGYLALVDLANRRLERVLELPGHNIRGLAVTADGSQLLVSLQDVDSTARTNREDIVWGVLMSNTLLSVPLEGMITPRKNFLHGLRFLPLGEPSGDPQRIIVNDGGEIAVALGGVRRVAVGRHTWPRLDHIPVSMRPTDLAFGSDGRLYVANMLSDSISVIDVERRKPLTEISLGPQSRLEEADTGELLFYDATLSLRGWMSCHSCHSDGHSSGILVDTLGDGSYGAAKRVPSLLDVAQTGPWAWNGSMRSLRDQIHKSMQTTLHARGVSREQVRALEAFLRTLKSPRLAPLAGTDAIDKGEQAFQTHRCYRCHAPPAYTSRGAHDVGLSDKAGNTRFNAPSLLGVRYRTTFFHDGRARSLREVFELHQHPVEIPPGQISDLIAFLSTLQN